MRFKALFLVALFSSALFAADNDQAGAKFTSQSSQVQLRSTDSGGVLTPHVILGSGSAAATQAGATNYANNQVALSVTASTVVAARATRRQVVIQNLSATITVYVGAATVSATNGIRLEAGQSITINAVGLVQGIAASGTPSVAYMEVYD